MYRIVFGAVLLQALGSAAPAQAQADNVVVQTDSGPVRGVARTNYTEWLGIPYAAPPVGELRWKAPQPVAKWSQVRDASQPGNACVQGTGWDPGYEEPTLTEDCLYLNIYRPHGASPEAKLPVFFWIHGGGLVGGAGYDSDPRKFLDRGGVVFVTHNYRLGALGFLAVPGLTGEDRDAVGNYGMLDQQAALRWVKANIASFGGDPDRITIAGQSAGGRSVCNQLVSPSNEGLFVGAVHQSGGCNSVSIPEAEQTGARFAAAVGCQDSSDRVACLRAKSAAEILAAQANVRISTTVYGGKHFPMEPAEAVRRGSFNKVPVMIGQTRDERTLSMFGNYDHKGQPLTEPQYEAEVRKRYGELADEVLALYPVSEYSSPTIALANVEGDQRSCERRELYGRFAAHTPTYVYEFDERDPPSFVSVWRLHSGFPFGATHVNELPYLWDYLRYALPFTSAQSELSAQMISYWTSFVRSRDPNGDFTPDWPRYSPEEEPMMSLKASGTAVKTSFAEEHNCAFWQAGE